MLNGVTPCTLRATGYKWDDAQKREVVVATQNVTLPACPLYIRCKLTQVTFGTAFRGLSGVRFEAYIPGLGIPQGYMMDELKMEWANNSCAAGILRIGHS
jgi:hypothetical protein